MPELKDLLNAINCKATKWYVIGLNLDLTPDELDIIDDDGSCVEERLRKMLKKCLSKKNPPLTWTALIQALRQPAVNEELLASLLEKRYVPNDNDFTSQRPIVGKYISPEQIRSCTQFYYLYIHLHVDRKLL